MPVECDLKEARFVWNCRFINLSASIISCLLLWTCDDSGASHTRTGKGKAVDSRGAMKHIEFMNQKCSPNNVPQNFLSPTGFQFLVFTL